MTELQRGDRIGPYLVEKRLSSGGMADIYRARPDPLVDGFPRRVVVKVAKPGFDDLLRDEEEHLRTVHHPHIVRPLRIPAEGEGGEPARYIRRTTGDGPPRWYMAIEYLPGGSLADLLQFRRRLPPDVAVAIASQIAVALDHLHRVGGVIHLDVRPDNILFRRDPLSAHWEPEAVLCDLGIAWHSQQRPEERYGDLPYVAPEHRRGEPVTPACDVYSLGIVLYEALTGVRPYPEDESASPGADPASSVQASPSLRKRCRISPRLEAVILKAIARDPAERYPSMSALLEDLAPVQIEQAARWRRKRLGWRRMLRWGSALALIGLVATVALVVGLLLDGALPQVAVPPVLGRPAATETPTAAAPLPALGPPSPAASPTLPAAERSGTPTPVATTTPTRTATPTPTSTVTPTPTPSPTQTNTPTATPSPTATTLKPTKAPGPQFAAPALQSPSDGEEFAIGSAIVLRWSSVGQLPDGAYYAVSVAFAPKSDPAQTWYDQAPWTRETQWTLSEHGYLPDLSADGQFRWSVQVFLNPSRGPDNRPVGTPLSPKSAEWRLVWKAEEGGSGPPPPTGTPTAAPPQDIR